MAKKNSPYFDDFIKMAECSVKAAEYLQTVMTSFHPDTLAAQREAMHEIERSEDTIRHGVMKRLVKEFIPPIDREDIIQLASELDTVTDKIDDILIRMYMYSITQMRPEAVDFADVIVSCCKKLHAAMVEFPNFQKSTILMQAIIDINTMEEKGDNIYIEAMRKLYQEESNPIAIMAWSELFDKLEDCCDACEHVADALETIAMKNS